MLRKKILIVDDSEFIRKVISFALEGKYEIVTAENGLHALEILYNHKIDLIISDIIMPVMDGYEFVKRIKKEDSLKDIPVIILTTESYKDTKKEFKKLGISDYIVKPVDSDILLEIVDKYLLKGDKNE